MPLEVACPACGTKLRAPNDAVGKRVKCRKCEHRFRIPGDIPGEIIAEPVGESQMLSIVEPASPPPVTPPIAPSGDPFSFDEPGGPVVSVGGRGRKPAARKPDRRDDELKPEPLSQGKRDDKPAKSGGTKKILLIVGGILVFLFLLCVGGVAAVYFFILAPAIETVRTLPTAKPTIIAVPTEAEPGPANKVPDARPKGGKGGRPVEKAAAEPDKADAPAGNDATAAKPKAAPAAKPGSGALVAPRKQSVIIDVPLEALIDVTFGGGESPTIAVLWESDKGFQGAGGKESVDLVTVLSGFRSARFEFPAVGNSPRGTRRGFTLCPSGKFVALERPMNKLTLIQPDAKKLIVDAKDPFEGEAWANGRIRLLAFPGTDSHVVALENSGLGNAWATADGKPVKSTVERMPFEFPAGKPLSLFPHNANSATAAMYFDGKLSTVSLDPKAVGTIKSSVAAPPSWAAGKAYALVADGKAKTFAAFVGTGIATFVNAKKPGGASHPRPDGEFITANFFNGDRLLATLTDNPPAISVKDLERGQDLYSASLPDGGSSPYGPRIFLDPAQNLIWYAVKDADATKTRLIAVRPDPDDAQTLLDESKAAGRPMSLACTVDGLKR